MTLKESLLYFYGVYECEQKCVSWFGNLAISLWKSSGNIIKVVCSNPGSK